ncbi:hypothetical protein D9613_000603 [Agrocybe pediades]|uniref:Uncharacterized protein n=1 Tax=Agrocybe pediades TaxID=84607 RepID=A0A8H4VU79_9AGAR|nr:hypothetical protein D9613_000603 [Agrocybe pediades]KAF9562784.1 hypothetical protein CPC08DRAFT_735070 [Agrocybe pediades]
MSFVRRALVVSSRTRGVFAAQRRAASSSHGHEDHQHHHQDSTVYPAETFGSPFWRNVALAGLATAAFFKLAPEAGDDVYLTRWIALYTAPRDYWLSLNAKHTAQQAEASADTMLVNDAERPSYRRFSYPQALEQASPFLNQVGMNVDMSGVVPRK